MKSTWPLLLLCSFIMISLVGVVTGAYSEPTIPTTLDPPSSSSHDLINLDVLSKLAQTGSAVLLMVAGWYFLNFLGEERKATQSEREKWFGIIEGFRITLTDQTRATETALERLERAEPNQCIYQTAEKRGIIEKLEKIVEKGRGVL